MPVRFLVLTPIHTQSEGPKIRIFQTFHVLAARIADCSEAAGGAPNDPTSMASCLTRVLSSRTVGKKGKEPVYGSVTPTSSAA